MTAEDTTESNVAYRILLVDDVRLFLELQRTFLRRLECDTLTASSGEEALDVVKARRPSLVVLDDQMPGMGGLEACRRIKADPEVSGTLVLMASSPSMEPACGDAGADDFLGKPIVQDVFLGKVRALLPEIRLRANERSFVRFHVEAEFGDRSLHGHSRDVSLTGLFVRCDDPPEPGAEGTLRLGLPGREAPLLVSAVVRNRIAPGASSRLSTGFGVEFPNLSEKQRAVITDFLRGVEE